MMFNRNFLFLTYNHIIRMNSKVQHFNDSIQMLRLPIDPCLTAPPSPSKIPEKQTTLSPNQKSLERYQKSNICPSESQSMCGQGRLGLNWSIQQQNTLVALHNSRGNKWVQIAHLLGKSDNEVKNRYHSKLRKGIRKINKLITDSRLPLKNVKSNIISKIIQTAEDRYLPLPNTPAPHATEAYQLKNAILDIAGLPEEGLSDLEREMMRRTIDRITSFNKSYRKKCKVAPVRPVVSCKYKGKEIKTLLKENEQTAFKNKVRERERQAKELEEPSINQDFHSDLQEQFPVNSSGQFQTYFVFSQPCMSFPSFYLACLPTGHLEPCDRFSSVQFEGSQPFPGAQMGIQTDSISF